MSYSKILLALLICFSMGCTDLALIEKPEPLREDAASREGSFTSTQTVTIQTIQLSALQAGIGTTLNSIRTAPSTYEFTAPDGSKYAKFRNVAGSTAFNYQNEIRVYKPAVFTESTWDEIRAKVVTELNKFSTGASPGGTVFKSHLLSWFDYMRTLDTQTFAQFETKMESLLNNISNPPFGISKLTEKEKFALTQAYYSILNIAKWVWQNPNPNGPQGSNNCLENRTKEEWKEVAEAAFTTGMVSGATVGWIWAQAGAAATSAAGQPWVGGVVGGVLGFVTGFVGGAAAGGGIKMMWYCVSDKLFTPRITVLCKGGFMHYGFAPNAIPSGCINLNPEADVPSIKSLGLVPNKGRTALQSTVVSDINWLLGFF